MSLLLALLLAVGGVARAGERDSTGHAGRVGASLAFMPGKSLALDEYAKRWIQTDQCYSLAAELAHVSLPSDSDDYAADYGYPELALGLRWALNHGTHMRRYSDPAWGKLVPVDFDTKLGNTLSLYLTFRRALLRGRRIEVGYAMSAGVGYSKSKYNLRTDPDNEFIGSRWLIYFGASLYAQYRFAREWALRAAVDFYHHSNGALNRPNKGANTVGSSLALVYMPYYAAVEGQAAPSRRPFRKYFYLNFAAGVGGKVLNEEWQLTQFRTDPSSPGYRTDRFRFYVAYSAQADLMYRYARRWASGVGADLFYGTYADRVAEIDEADGYDLKHSRWSFGLAAKHQAYYHNLSVAMSFGVYLYRHMGDNANKIEAPYYERIGVHYAFPSLGGLELGINVKAHKTKADLTELVVAMPVRL